MFQAVIGNRKMNNIEILSRTAERNRLKFLLEPDNGGEVAIMEGLGCFGREDECIFAECNDDEVTSLLTAWLVGELKGDRDVEFQLARLFAEKGSAVKEQLQKVINRMDWSRYGRDGLRAVRDGLHRLLEYSAMPVRQGELPSIREG